MQQTNKNIPYYVVAFAIFLALKFLFTFSDTEGLQFLLKPTSAVVSVVTGETCYFVPGTGYFYPGLNIAIDKSCSGFNFMALCFVMLLFLAIRSAQTPIWKIVAFPILFLVSSVLTVFVNASRILLSIVIHAADIKFLNAQPWLHQAEGIFTYLFFLIVIYISCEFLIHFILKRHAKLTQS